MKFANYSLCFLVVVTGVWITGCGRAPVRPAVKPATATPEGDAFRKVNEIFRYTENTRAGDEWTRFRGGFDLLANHFVRPEVVESMRSLAAKNRKFLETDVHLTADELVEVESTSFRTADAHYLDECFLLRDAHRSLEVAGLEPIEQARLHFRWVMRNVLSHEQTDSWVPSAFTLRRGYGSPLERALVFLALLRQAQIEGCLIVVPDAEPTQFLVAVLDPSSKNSGMHLFDPRLGLPLLSKDGAKILTLKDALADPFLLRPSLIAPDQAKKLEAWLVCPLYALAPRLLELQRGLGRQDTIILHMDAPALANEIAKAALLPVKVWNPPTAGKMTPNSPTRCLRLFLSRQEGGTDETNGAAWLAKARVPMANILANYERINFTAHLLPKAAFELMVGVSADLFNKYELQTREMYLRGLYDSVARRHERLQLFAKDDGLVGLARNRDFRTELIEWQKEMSAASANAADDDPRVRAKGLQAIQSLWSRDQFIGWMIELNKEEKYDHSRKKTVVTKVLAVGMQEYFDFALARSQASISYEKAEDLQARLPKNPGGVAAKEARDAWMVAKSSWANFYLARIVLDSTIKLRLEQIQRVPLEQIDKRIALLETLHLEVQKYFHAKLLLAECRRQLDGLKASREEMGRIRDEIDALQRNGLLRAEIKALQDKARQLPAQSPARLFLERRLDLLARDWAEQGSYFWMKQRIETKIAPTPSHSVLTRRNER